MSRDVSLEGLAAMCPALRPHWSIGVVQPVGPCAEMVRGAPPQRASLITPEEIDELLRKGAKNANELHKQLEECHRLTPAQWNLRLR